MIKEKWYKLKFKHKKDKEDKPITDTLAFPLLVVAWLITICWLFFSGDCSEFEFTVLLFLLIGIVALTLLLDALYDIKALLKTPRKESEKTKDYPESETTIECATLLPKFKLYEMHPLESYNVDLNIVFDEETIRKIYSTCPKEKESEKPTDVEILPTYANNGETIKDESPEITFDEYLMDIALKLPVITDDEEEEGD